MAAIPKRMSIIKQVLTRHKNGMSFRELAIIYSLSPITVQRYLKIVKEDTLNIETLVAELNHRFNGGNHAY